MYRPELDGRFYEIAMSFFIEAGHVSTSEPEYCNLSLNHISGVSKASIESIDELEFDSVNYFDKLSFLFKAHQCMFFSMELLPGKKQRSRIARDIHELIHTFVEYEASVCVFRHGNEMMFSFIGYGSRCILSDWYSIDDLDGELAQKLDLSNAVIKSDYDYFCDLIYSLGRNYYYFHEDNSVYNLCPIDGITRLEKGIWDSGKLEKCIQDNAVGIISQYEEDYIEYKQSKRTSDYEITHSFDMMIFALDRDILFGDKPGFDDEDESYMEKTIDELDEIDSLQHISVLQKGRLRNEKAEEKKGLDRNSTKKEQQVYNPLVNRERNDAIAKVFSALNRVERKLEFREICDISGIRNIEAVAAALEIMCKRGEVGRVWRRGKCLFALSKKMEYEFMKIYGFSRNS